MGIETEGLDELLEIFANAENNLHRVGKAQLRDWSIYGVKQAQINILNKGAVDTNELIQSMHYNLSDTPLESVIQPSDKAQEYAVPLELGSRPHMPPIDALQGWADRHGIPVWALAKKIARDGTEGRHYWEATYNDLDEHIQGDLPDFAEEIARWL